MATESLGGLAISNPIFWRPLSSQVDRLNASLYPFRCVVPLRWSDVSAAMLSGHIVAQWFEDARIGMTAHNLGHQRQRMPRDGTSMVRAIELEYLEQARFGEPLELAAGISHTGNTSFTYALAVFQRGRCLALGDTVVVHVDADHRPAPLSDRYRRQLGHHRLHQFDPAAQLRSDTLRLRSSAYSNLLDLPTRFSDTDAVGHVNNVAIARYHDNAGMAFQLQSIGVTPGQDMAGRWSTRRARISLLAETHYPERIQMAVAVKQIADDGMVLAQGLFQNGRCRGLADVHVQFRGDSLPPAWRSRLEELLFGGQS